MLPFWTYVPSVLNSMVAFTGVDRAEASAEEIALLHSAGSDEPPSPVSTCPAMLVQIAVTCQVPVMSPPHPLTFAHEEPLESPPQATSPSANRTASEPPTLPMTCALTNP